MIKSGIFILITFWLGLAIAQDPPEVDRELHVQVTQADGVFMDSALMDNPEDVLELLAREQAADVARGLKVKTVIVTDDPHLVLPKTNNPYLDGNTYSVLIDDGKTVAKPVHSSATKRSILYSVMRSAGSLVMYTLIFPKNYMVQSLAIVGLHITSNYLYRHVDTWNNLQEGLQQRVFQTRITKYLLEIGIPQSAIEFTTRVGFNLGHGALWAVPSILILGTGSFNLIQYLDTVRYSFAASAAFDETLNKFSNRRGMELLTKVQYVNANFLRTLTFMVLTPLVQAGNVAAQDIGLVLLAAGTVSYWLPQGILKARDFAKWSYEGLGLPQGKQKAKQAIVDLGDFHNRRAYGGIALGLSCSLPLSGN